MVLSRRCVSQDRAIVISSAGVDSSGLATASVSGTSLGGFGTSGRVTSVSAGLAASVDRIQLHTSHQTCAHDEGLEGHHPAVVVRTIGLVGDGVHQMHAEGVPGHAG